MDAVVLCHKMPIRIAGIASSSVCAVCDIPNISQADTHTTIDTHAQFQAASIAGR